MVYVAVLVLFLGQMLFVWSMFPYALAHFMDGLNQLILTFQKPKQDLQNLAEGIHAMSVVMKSSHGVYGMDFNGALTPWETLKDGGEMEQWLWKFSRAQDIADRVLHENQKSYILQP